MTFTNKFLPLFAALFAVQLVSQPAHAATVTYTDRVSFEATLGASVTDDYSDPGYVFIQSNTDMSAVLGETDYESTGFDDLNIVTNAVRYCAGCNGSFKLSFQTTSVGTATGVFGVGFDFLNNAQVFLYNAYVEFGDGSFTNFALPQTDRNLKFFGITSDLLITSIHLGLANGATTRFGNFQLDNLTVGAQAVPEPATGLLLGLGALGMSWRKRRAKIER